MIDVVADFIKNIPKHIDTLKGWIDEFIASLAKITRVFSDDVYKLYEKLGVTIKKVPQQPVLASGIPVPVGDNLYALVREGKEVFRGSKKEVEELAEKLKGLDDAEAKKYLDDLSDSLFAIKAKKLPEKTSLRLRKYADEVVQAIQRSKDKKGAVYAIQYKGEVFYGKSFKGFERGKFPELHPILDDWVQKRWAKMDEGIVERLCSTENV